MKFLPGMSGNPKGRPKGLKDRRLQKYDMLAALDKKKFNPGYAMIKIATDETIDAGVRRAAIKDILDRVVPVMRYVETAEDPMTKDQNEKFKQELKGLLLKHKKEY